MGGDTVDTVDLIKLLAETVPASAGTITSSGGPLPIASRLDDAALRADYPSLLRIGISDGIAETVEVFRGLKAAGKLKV